MARILAVDDERAILDALARVLGRDGHEVVKAADPTAVPGTDLSRFDLSDCRFHLLHKPYGDISALKVFLRHIIDGDNSFDDLSEDSFSENEDYPQVTEWKL